MLTSPQSSAMTRCAAGFALQYFSLGFARLPTQVEKIPDDEDMPLVPTRPPVSSTCEPYKTGEHHSSNQQQPFTEAQWPRPSRSWKLLSLEVLHESAAGSFCRACPRSASQRWAECRPSAASALRSLFSRGPKGHINIRVPHSRAHSGSRAQY